MKILKVCALPFIFFIGLMITPASASCTQDANGDQVIQRVAGTQLTATCRSDIQQYVNEITQIGLCPSFPVASDVTDVGPGLAQCQNVLNEPLDITLAIGSSQAISARGPRPGSYNFFYQLIPAKAQYKALWKFAQSITGGDGTNIANANQSGTYCYPAPFEYTTSTIFDGIRPNVCVNTEPTSLPLSTYFFNNVGFSTWEGITSIAAPDTAPTDRGYEIDTDAYQNIILLDDDLNIIQTESNKANTAYVLAIQKLTPALQVSSGDISLTFETTLTDKARVSVGCGTDINTQCVLNTPYTSTALNLILD